MKTLTIIIIGLAIQYGLQDLKNETGNGVVNLISAQLVGQR